MKGVSRQDAKTQSPQSRVSHSGTVLTWVHRTQRQISRYFDRLTSIELSRSDTALGISFQTDLESDLFHFVFVMSNVVPVNGGYATPKLRRRRRIWMGIVCLTGFVAAIVGGRAYWLSLRPNVLLITLDTTRSDRIGCYGYNKAQTPALDALAAQGIVFERAYTPAPLTLPAHASLMTGLYPPEHGLITNGRGRLADGVPTLAESLQRAGYDTAAFVGSFVLHSKFGLTRGFEIYDDDMTNTEPTEHGLHRQRDGKRVVDRALSWLSQPRRKPFLCWVHLYDPHHPYVMHEDEFGDQFKELPYEGEIAYVDRLVGRLVDYLDQNQLRRQTLIVVVGDHGEGLGEHDEEEHSLTLYDATLRVPWIWAGYGVTTDGRRVPQTVTLTDLSPTVLDTLGQKSLPGVNGRSLRPALQGDALDAVDCFGMSDDPLFEHGCAPVRSLATAEWKYIRSTEPELYDLAADPHELKNLAKEQPERLAEMESRLANLESAMTLRKSADVQLSPQERRALESLGYLGGADSGAKPKEDGLPLPDIKRILPLANAVQNAKNLIKVGSVDEAERELRQLVAAHPEYIDGHVLLAHAMFDQSKYSECEEILRDILRRDADNYHVYFLRGLLDLVHDQQQAAIDKFRKSLELKPDAIGVLYNLGLNLLQMGQPQEAKRYFEDTLEVDPAYVKALIGLGMALTALRQIDSAIQQYRTALSYEEASVESHTNLAVLLLQQNRQDEGGRHMARAAELAPDNPETRFNYGTYLLTVGRLDDAIAELSAAVRLKPDHPHAAGRLRNAQMMRSRQR